jgi:hypothetical protein
VGRGFCISIYWIYIRRSLHSLITFPITSHKLVTSSGSYSWGTAVTNCCVELLWRTALAKFLWQTPMADSLGETPIPDCYDRLPWQTALADRYDQTDSIINPSCFYNLGDQLLVCSFPRYMHIYRPLLSCNNTPLFWLPRLLCLQNCWEKFSCIRGYIILVNYVSVAWQWIFPA